VFSGSERRLCEAQTGSHDWLARGTDMESYVYRENIRLYRRLLAATTDEQKRQILLQLLRDEEAKYQRPPKKKQG
jgi:rubrerythrin